MRVSGSQLIRLMIMKAIRRHGPISRTELTSLTGLASATVTDITAELLSNNLIVELKDQQKKRGRPRVQLQINPAGAAVIAVNLTSRSAIEIAVVDLCGGRLEGLVLTLRERRTLGHLALEMAAAISDLISQSSLRVDQITRIGISLPGVIDTIRGDVLAMTTFPPGPVSFSKIVEDKLRIPVTIENDMLCMARAEHWFGRAQRLDDFTVVYVGHTVGSAEYSGGLPYFRAVGIPPELAHVKVDLSEHARSCVCGARGCLMMYSSVFGLLSHLKLVGNIPASITELDQAFAGFLEGLHSPEHLQQLSIAGGSLGLALGNYLNATGPANLLIVCDHPAMIPLITDSFDRAIKAHTLPSILANSETRFEPASHDWRWQGAAALALEQIYLS